ncbi:unnamed protein product [Hymenolepis diminuta]|uniref:Deoxynucleoside kinase domain-containing protein n=1 Tax=Hymenolepis diminuta TaxID=6216 RepID=A0A564Z497_HYMDI|nr:unnamed protein product [Hymenolepis diminuta]
MNNRKVRIAVEGNIGCGKSTFLEEIKTLHPNIEVFPEPIDKWMNVDSFNLFENFYVTPHKWCSPFRSYVMTTISDQLSKPQTARVRLIERSIHSNFHCFTEANRDSGFISDGDYEVIKKYFDYLCSLPIFKLDSIIYLRSTPEICAERIKQRQRKGEEGIKIEYLEKLHDLHEKWLIESTRNLPAPLIIFDCTQSKDEVRRLYRENKEKILFGVRV